MAKLCKIADCGKSVAYRGWCESHYKRWLKYGDPFGGKFFIPKDKPCLIEGCDKPVKSNGLCSSHYTRQLRHGNPLAGGTANGVPIQWIKDHVDYSDDDCLTWPFGKSGGRAGLYRIGSRVISANVLMCELAHGPAPTSQHEAAHNCGNGYQACINPKHLEWKLHKDNIHDKFTHGTVARGEQIGSSVLTEQEVHEIRLLKGKMSQRAIAKKFGVTRGAVTGILRRTTWSWLK